jgi:hypothetical protein
VEEFIQKRLRYADMKEIWYAIKVIAIVGIEDTA